MENTVKDRLAAYLNKKRISFSEFGRQLGVSSAYVTSMKKSIPPEKVKIIREVYPDLNTDWLIYVEGDMLLSQGEHSNTQIGENHYNSDGAVSQALNEIAEQRKLTAKSQEQIDRLLGIIETLQQGS